MCGTPHLSRSIFTLRTRTGSAGGGLALRILPGIALLHRQFIILAAKQMLFKHQP